MNSVRNESSPELAFAGALSPAAFILPGTKLASTWLEHTPFALWLVEALRPARFVELGTLHGVSYFTFCEAVQRLGCGTRCFAIDTWAGDEHTGFYDEAVWRHVSELNRSNYAAFSTLLRRTFDDALVEFPDGSIDLLHVDGRHFYEDVKHDFESWIPKLTPSAVVIFHDTNVHERNFGVARYWRELKGQYPTFEFDHGSGLGVLAFGQVPPGLNGLFAASQDPVRSAAVRTAYARLGAAVADRLSLRHEESLVARLRSDIAIVQADGAASASEVVRLTESLQSEAQASTTLRAQLEQALAEQKVYTEQALTKQKVYTEQALTKQGADYEQRIEVLRGRRVALEAEVERFQHEARGHDAAAANLRVESERLAGEVAELHQLVDALRNSTSWRITAPMRWLTGHFRRPTRLVRRALGALRRGQVGAQVRKAIHDVHAWRELGASCLLDRDWYLGTYPDVANQGRDALWHFIRSGAAEGRQPSALFDVRWYLDMNPDVRDVGVNPLLHYLRSGAAEGRDPSPGFDSDWYLSAYKDVAAAGINPLAHYQAFGKAEGRLPKLPQSQAEVRVRAPGSSPKFKFEPLISIVTPVYNVEGRWLRRAIESVQAQTYAKWEFCICDDGSTNPDTIQTLAELESHDSRIRVVRPGCNAGISRATNQALELAGGEFVALLDNDDELTADALETCVAVLNRNPSIDVMYSDEDKLDASGQCEEPFFKPDWSAHLLREVMYVGHLLVARRSLVLEVGGLDATYDGVQDFELMLRLSERTRNIHHVRKILYHWRRIPGSVADHSDAKPGLGLKQVAAVNAHLARLGERARAVPHPNLQHRAVIQPEARSQFPKISIVIPTKDAGEHISRCLDSIYAKTAYPDFEVVVVDNGTTDPVALAAMQRHPIVHVPFVEPFNFSRANNVGVAAASGEILVLLNNDTEVVREDWLEQMAYLLEQPEVGAVGPLLLYPDGTVQHAGVALGMRGTADHVMRCLTADADGYFGALACTREVSAVTFACVMLRKVDYLAVGGLVELYRTHYQDVDLCLRLIGIGRKILYTPRTRLVHYESATRGTTYDHMDRALFLDAWADKLAEGDPYSRWEPEARSAEALA
ncbi:glycosyltransferase [Variovorax sp. LARHSF232]